VIYCVVPREFEADLYDQLVRHYEASDGVTVIVDRRTGPDRRHGSEAGELAERRRLRDRRRMRIPGTFADTDPPAA
jgi:hypothetical protein